MCAPASAISMMRWPGRRPAGRSIPPSRAARYGHLPGRPDHPGGTRAPQRQRPPIGAGPRDRRARDPPSGGQGGHRGGHRSGARHVEVLPALRHRHLPSHPLPRPRPPGQRGWKWSICPRCGLSCDRDFAAAERIVSRGPARPAPCAHRPHQRGADHHGRRRGQRRPRPPPHQTGRRPAAAPARHDLPHQDRPHPQTPHPHPATRQGNQAGRVSVSPRFSRQVPDRRPGSLPPSRFRGAASVRRDSHPRTTVERPWKQGLHAILRVPEPASTTSAPPPSCRFTRRSEPARGHARPECLNHSGKLRESQTLIRVTRNGETL